MNSMSFIINPIPLNAVLLGSAVCCVWYLCKTILKEEEK